jgi:hypothetical protein
VRQKLCRRLEELEKISAAAAAYRERMKPRDHGVLDELRAKPRHGTLSRKIRNGWQGSRPTTFITASSHYGRNWRRSRLVIHDPLTREGFDEWSVAGARSLRSRISFVQGIRACRDYAWR